MAWTGGSRESSLCILKVGLIAGPGRLNVRLEGQAFKPEVEVSVLEVDGQWCHLVRTGELGDHSSLWGHVKTEMLLVVFRGQVKETLVCLT